MEKTTFEDLKIGDTIECRTPYSKFLGGGVKGIIVDKGKFHISLNLIGDPMIVLFAHGKTNEYYMLPDPPEEEFDNEHV